MTIKSGLRFLYIFGRSGPLCAAPSCAVSSAATAPAPKVNLETDFWNQFPLLTSQDSICYSLFLLNHENCDLLEKKYPHPLILPTPLKKICLYLQYIYFCYTFVFKWFWNTNLNMKPGEVQTYLPPPPHKIVDYLNGSIIGHNVMKKAISVAIYNHFCNINFSRYEQLCKSHLFFHFIP